MKKLNNILAGFAGAVALNVLHESLKRRDQDMPRIDLLGEDALQKLLSHFGIGVTQKKELHGATLAGDVLSNTLYYSLIGLGSSKLLWSKAILSGLTAGIGAVTLPEPMGLDALPVTKTPKTKVLTVAYYLTGAIVTALILKALKK